MDIRHCETTTIDVDRDTSTLIYLMDMAYCRRCRIAPKTVFDIDQGQTNVTRWFSYFSKNWS